MAIVRADDPRANDVKHQVLLCLGKLLDKSISVETQKSLMSKLTDYLKGKGYDAHAFSDLGLIAKVQIASDGSSDRVLMIYVPKEYVSSNITENRDDQWISFTITKATNVENLKGDVAYYDDVNLAAMNDK